MTWWAFTAGVATFAVLFLVVLWVITRPVDPGQKRWGRKKPPE